MELVVLDRQGRIYLPKQIREKIKSNKFILKFEDNKLILIPFSIEEKIKKLRGIIKIKKYLSLEEIEKKTLEESKKIIKKEI